MNRIALSILLAAGLVSAAAARQAPTSPPYGGTIFIDGDIITPADPTALVSVTATGRGVRTMFDRRVNNWVQQNAYLFAAVFDDMPGRTVEIQVNPEFSSVESARAQADRFAPAIGRLPNALRKDLETVWIHAGTQPFGGGNRNLLIHVGQADQYDLSGILEETLVHEAAHTSLDAYHAAAPGWVAAQQADPTFISTYARDYPTREDIAESFLPWLALRHRRSTIDAVYAQNIERAMPNRVAYFDGLNLDLRPLVATGTGVDDASLPAPSAPRWLASYPNPFAGSTTVSFELDRPTDVRVAIFDLLGRSVATLADGTMQPGVHTLGWDGRDDARAGMYFAVLRHRWGVTATTLVRAR